MAQTSMFSDNSEMLHPMMDSLDLENTIDTNNNVEIIITIRVDKVIEHIKQFVSDNKLVPNSANDIFKLIHIDSASSIPTIHPSQLLYNKQRVIEMLNNIDLQSIPKITTENITNTPTQ
jgi:hypothetical protein